jgi:hypothetical protein
VNKPEKPSENTTGTQKIGTIRIREEEGLTSGKPVNENLSEAELNGIAGGITATVSGDSRVVTTTTTTGGIVGGIPTSKLMPE